MMLKKIFCVFALLIFANACEKNDPIPQKTPVTFHLEKDIYLPMEMMHVLVEGDWFAESAFVEINGIQVPFVQTNTNTLAFFCPLIDPGKYMVTYAGRFSLEFTLDAQSQTINTSQVIQDFQGELGTASSQIDNSNLRAALEDFKSELNNHLTQATPEQKQAFAYFIANNGLDDPSFFEEIHSDVPDSFYMKNSTFDPSDAAKKFMTQFTVTKIQIIGLLWTCVTSFTVPSPDFITKGIALVSGSAALVKIARLKGYLENDLSNLLMKAVDVELFNKKANEVELKVDQYTTYGLSGNFNNITQDDKGKGIFPVFFSALDETNNALSAFYNAYKKVKSWFSNEPADPGTELLQTKPQVKSGQFALNPQYISILDVSDKNIHLSSQINGANLEIKAESNLTEKTNFTFRIKYKQETLDHTLEKTIQAIFIPKAGVFYMGSPINSQTNPNNNRFEDAVFNITAPIEYGINPYVKLQSSNTCSGTDPDYFGRSFGFYPGFNSNVLCPLIGTGTPYTQVLELAINDKVDRTRHYFDSSSSSNALISIMNKPKCIAGGGLQSFGPFGRTFYIGFKFNVTGLTHYGWMKISIDSALEKFSILEYAYNLTPFEAIKVGEK